MKVTIKIEYNETDITQEIQLSDEYLQYVRSRQFNLEHLIQQKVGDVVKEFCSIYDKKYGHK